MRYSTVLLDLDHTLLDSDASELAAFNLTLRAAGCQDPQPHFDTYRRINGGLWAAVERGEISPNDVKTRRFVELTSEVGLEADPILMATNFVAGLAEHGELYPGARQMLDALVGLGTVRLGLVTNGIGNVQRTRLKRLEIDQYFDAIAISGEVGTSKPGREIFDLIFADLSEPNRDEALMVGDSLTSDIAGGVAAKIDTAWYNPHGHTPDGAPTFTHEFRSLGALVAIVSSKP